jgi:hypothetical protein
VKRRHFVKLDNKGRKVKRERNIQLRRPPMGSLMRWTNGINEMWFVVDRLGKMGAPHGPCFYASEGVKRAPGNYPLGRRMIDPVADADVPDWVWAELAKFRLLK